MKPWFSTTESKLKRQRTVMTEVPTFQQVRRQMNYFNISVCYAKCCYIQKARLAMMAVTHPDFQAVVEFNKALFELLDKKQDIFKALGHITTAIERLESDPPRDWLVMDDLKRRISFCLLFLRERVAKSVDKVELAV